MSPDDPSEEDVSPEYELLSLLADEFRAGGIECGVAAALGGVPAQLIVDVAGGDSVHICFLPEHDQPPVLQYLVALAVDLTEDAVGDTARFAALVNTTLPLTGFEVSEALRSVVFRYLQPVSVHPLDPAVIAWPLSMIHFAISYYAGMIAAVGTGTPYDEVVAGFAAKQAEVLSVGDG